MSEDLGVTLNMRRYAF